MASLPPFRHLSDIGKAMLGPGLQQRLYGKKAPLLGKGQSVSGAYIVVSGRLRVYTLSRDGHEATLYTIAPGETCVLALNCIFNDLLYPAWVEADTDSCVAMIPGALYRVLFANEAVIRELTVNALATVVFRLMAELEQIHSCTVPQRLANFLLLHAATGGSLPMTQQEIASHLGTTREVVARHLRQWAADGIVQTRRAAVVVRRPERLAEIQHG